MIRVLFKLLGSTLMVMFYFHCSFAQQDLPDTLIEVTGVSKLSAKFFETSFKFGGALGEVPHGRSTIGIDIYVGYQKIISGNNSLSLFAGLNSASLANNPRISLCLGTRYSTFYKSDESYLETSILFSGANGKNKYPAGFSLRVGQKYHTSNLGLFLAYDHYLKDLTYSGKYFSLGLTLHKKAALFGTAGLGVLALLAIMAIRRSK